MKIEIRHYLVIFICLVISLLITSCVNHEKELFNSGKLKYIVPLDKKGMRNGTFKEYYENGNLKTISQYKSGKLVDSTLYYDLNRQLRRIKYYFKKDSIFTKEFKGDSILTGYMYDDFKIGNWNYYVKNKKVKTEEYILINLPKKKSHLNQVYVFNNSDKYDPVESRYYHIDFPDDMTINEEYLVKVRFNFPQLNEQSSDSTENLNFLMISQKLSEDFTTPKGSKIDTLVPLSAGEFKFVYRFKSPGKQKFRGIIHSYLFKVGKDSTDISIGEMLIEKEITLKDGKISRKNRM